MYYTHALLNYRKLKKISHSQYQMFMENCLDGSINNGFEQNNELIKNS